MLLDLLRMHNSSLAYELPKRLCSLAAHSKPGRAGRAFRSARMHQRLKFPSHEAIIDEEVFMDSKLRVAPFEIAGAISLYTMPEDQVLRTCRRADRISLHKTHPVQRSPQGCGWEEASGDSKRAHIVERDRHLGILPKVADRIRPQSSL